MGFWIAIWKSKDPYIRRVMEGAILLELLDAASYRPLCTPRSLGDLLSCTNNRLAAFIHPEVLDNCAPHSAKDLQAAPTCLLTLGKGLRWMQVTAQITDASQKAQIKKQSLRQNETKIRDYQTQVTISKDTQVWVNVE